MFTTIFTIMTKVDVLIPTYNRVTALAVTLTCLIFQTYKNFRIIISDQTKDGNVSDNKTIQAIARVLNKNGNSVQIFKHLPRLGIAEQREFLLDKVTSPYSLFLDDDLILEPYVIKGMVKAIGEEHCGFVGRAVVGLSFLQDVRPHEQTIEFWDTKVKPETITPKSKKWQRYKLHNAANLLHVEKELGITYKKQKKYKVAWVGGCVLYDSKKLRSAGGFEFWKNLPKKHSGEDVLAQIRVMKQFGGCGILPSGVYHQELPTTVKERNINAPEHLLV